MEQGEFVFSVTVVRKAIADLSGRSIHPFFPAYLYLRQAAKRQGTDSAIKPRWKELAIYLEIAGAAPQKPYFRPFAEGSPGANQGWLNANLAGSFAGSSLRPGRPAMLVVDYDRSTQDFALRERHWELAREHLLDETRVPVGSLCAFLLRDFAFISDSGPPTAEDMVDVFLSEFGYDNRDSEEAQYLYDLTILDAGVGGWFEGYRASNTD